MATEKQRQAAKKNIKKAQSKWKSMSSSGRSKAQPEGRARKKPGTTGEGNYYHVEVRPKDEFTAFRTQDVGDKGGLQRVAGKRSSGSWATTKWLIGKEDAHIENGKLVGDTKEVKDLIRKLGSEPVHKRGDRFEAKPSAAQKRARGQNSKKAQATRQKS